MRQILQIDRFKISVVRVIDKSEGKQPIQDQSSVLGADILNNYYGRSFNYPQGIQLIPKHQSGDFWCSVEVKLCNSIIQAVPVCNQSINQSNKFMS